MVSSPRTRHQLTVILIYAVDCGESTAHYIDLGNEPLKKCVTTLKIITIEVLAKVPKRCQPERSEGSLSYVSI